MTLTAWQVYLIMQMDAISCLIGIPSLILLIVFIFLWIAKSLTDERDIPSSFKEMKCIRNAIISFIVLFISFLIPTKEQVAAMYFLPAIVNNQDVRSIPPELAKLARVKLEELVRNTTE